MSDAAPPNISANAGDEAALSNPNSPESISRRARTLESQASEDTRYDAAPPERGNQGFTDYIVQWSDERKRSQEISSGLFLALGVLLFLYKAAPDAI
jgi:hypothetical protein